jgi:hypothetical protein
MLQEFSKRDNNIIFFKCWKGNGRFVPHKKGPNGCKFTTTHTNWLIVKLHICVREHSCCCTTNISHSLISPQYGRGIKRFLVTNARQSTKKKKKILLRHINRSLQQYQRVRASSDSRVCSEEREVSYSEGVRN